LADVFPNARDVTGIREELKAQLDKQPDDADLNFTASVVDVLLGNLPEAEARLARLAPADDSAKALLTIIRIGAIVDGVKHAAKPSVRQASADITGLEETPMTQEARARLITVLQAGGKSYEDYMRLGDYRFFMGDFTLAGEAYRAASKTRPDDAFALFAMAHAAFANSEYKQAVWYLESALALRQNWGLYDFRLQEFYGDSAEYQRHVKNLQRQVEMRPNVADMKFLLAYIYYFSGRYADAADLLTETLRLDPKFEQANYFLRLARLQG
jgi:thioredoxin-like negative regulator of GroEL